MMPYPHWLAQMLIEQQSVRKTVRADKRGVSEKNSFDRVVFEIGVLLAMALSAAAVVEIAMRVMGNG